jgi:hypothetical protein
MPGEINKPIETDGWYLSAIRGSRRAAMFAISATTLALIGRGNGRVPLAQATFLLVPSQTTRTVK